MACYSRDGPEKTRRWLAYESKFCYWKICVATTYLLQTMSSSRYANHTLQTNLTLTSRSARSFAFIAHESTHLKDSNFVFVSDDATKIAFFFWRDGAFIAKIRSNWSQVTASNADHALPAFCQKIWLAGLKLHPYALLAAGAITQNLFAAYDGNQLFIPSRLDLACGI